MKNSLRKTTTSIFSLFVFIGSVAIGRTVTAETVTLVTNGVANIEIVKPSSASDPEDFEYQAAYNLKEYLEKITGVTVVTKHEDETILKIPVYVGRCLASQHLAGTVEALINDGYVIEINETSIHLLGKNDLATRFAVYGFLEDYMDVRWFLPEVWGDGFPENMGTHIPQKETIELETTLDLQDPSFRYRYIGRRESREEQWTICNKMNFIRDDVHGFQTNAHAHSFRHFINPGKVHWDYRDYPEPNQLHYWDFPEYFRMLDGKFLDSDSLEAMTPDQAAAIKLNVGNPAVRDAMVEEVIGYIDDHPEVEIINLFPNDGRAFCESPQSKLMDGENLEAFTVELVNDQGRKLGEEYGRVLSKRYTMFYHDVTEMVLARKPDTLLMTGAYSAYNYAPLEVDEPAFITDYKLDDSVMLFITHSWEHNHPIRDRSTLPNCYFDDSVEDWKRLYSSLGVYEYYRKGAMNELPFPIIHSIRHDIPYYHDNGFSLFYTQFGLEDIGTYGLNYYIAAKLVWDVSADVDELLEDFYTKFYGDAADHMRLYHQTLEAAAVNSDLELSPKYYGAYLDLFTDEVIDKCWGHIGKAKDAAGTQTPYSERVKLSETSLDFTDRVIAYLKEIKNLFDNKVLWRTYDADVKKPAQDLADEIRTMLEENSDKTIVGTTYTDNLLTVSTALNKVRGYFYPEIAPENNFTKPKWIDKHQIDARRGYGEVEFFDVWIYAHDIDYANQCDERSRPEHQISIIDKSGDPAEIAKLARSVSESGNRMNKGFLLSGFSFEEYIGGDDSIELRILNFDYDQLPLEDPLYCSSDPYNSTFYAIAIMPHMDEISQDTVTYYYENDVNFIRRHSLGFIEFEERNGDNETLAVVLDLYNSPFSDIQSFASVFGSIGTTSRCDSDNDNDVDGIDLAAFLMMNGACPE